MTDQHRGFRWCFSTLGCPELSLPEACALARRFAIDGLELRSLNGRVDLPKLFEEQGWDATAPGMFREQRLSPAVAGSSFKLTSQSEEERSSFLDYASWADRLTIPCVRVFGGGMWGTPLLNSDYQAAAQNLQWWDEQKAARSLQIDLLVETHDAFSASAPCLELVHRAGKPVQFIWDSHHTWRLGGEMPTDTWCKLGAFVRHVHIKDSIDKPSARHPFTYVLPGEGQMPMGEVIAVLREHKFRGHVSLEWEKMWHPYLPPLHKALEAMRRLSWFDPQASESRGAGHSKSVVFAHGGAN
jgi:sugar phosphate isomerase/epimerase